MQTKFFFLALCDRYLRSRKPRQLMLGVPALLCLAAGSASPALLRRVDPAIVQTRCLETARQAERTDNLELWGLSLRRLQAFSPKDLALRFRYAEYLKKDGQPDRAARLIRSLAPLDEPGYAPAQLWVALSTLQQDPPKNADDAAKLIKHLEWSLVGPDAPPTAHAMLGEFHFREGRWAEAAKHLDAAAATRPDLGLMLAVTQRRLGRETAAVTAAERALAVLVKNRKADPADLTVAVRQADSLVFLGRRNEALQLLNQLNLTEADAGLRLAAAQLYLTLATAAAPGRRQPIDGPADAAFPLNSEAALAVSTELLGQIDLIERALLLAPNHPGILMFIARLATQPGTQGIANLEVLENALAGGKAPAAVHLVLGTNSYLNGDIEKGTVHLEQAYRLDSRMSVAANNLAYVLATSPMPQLDRALDLVESALRSMPNRAEFRETRGQILYRLGRHQEALADLEFALRLLPRQPPLHAALAEVYTALGDPSLAARHRALAAEAPARSPAGSKNISPNSKNP